MRATSGRAGRTDLIACIFMFAGLVVRVMHLLSGRSLYIDEARLALNIGTRGFARLMQPLDLEQIASVPYLWAVKAVSLALGMGEVPLRLVAFGAGVTMLPLFWLIARMLMPPQGARLSLLLVCIAPALVRASNELKPYSLDAMMTCVLVLLALRAVEGPALQGRIVLLGTWAFVASLVSLPGVLIALPLLVIVATVSWRAGSAMNAAWLAMFAAMAGIAAALPYSLLYRVVASSDYMRQFWAKAYLGVGSWESLGGSFLIVADFIVGLLLGGTPPGQTDRGMFAATMLVTSAGAGLLAYGVFQLQRSAGWLVASVVLAPAVALVAANLMHQYPLRLRLELSLVPGACLLVAVAIQGIAATFGKRQALIGRLAGGVVALPMAVIVLLPSMWPYHWQELGRVVGALAILQPGDAVYVSAGAAPAWAYYSTDWSNADLARLQWLMTHTRAGAMGFENAAHAPSGEADSALVRSNGGGWELLGQSTGQQWRPYELPQQGALPDAWVSEEAQRVVQAPGNTVWLVYAHYRPAENEVLVNLGRSGVQRQSLVAKGAYAFKYQFTQEAGQ